ncbi:Glyoxalase-like domain [Macleaya cordata]|uniref:Glyoxalase-like domain n=1 Tax=Macleaya cordata TaxID=56857 RepID=A0A200Q1W6_MACCD|nr:Glyoxalase-like domain [Macleaya cordata]
MASSSSSSIMGLFSVPSLHLNEANRISFSTISMNMLSTQNCDTVPRNSRIGRSLTAKAKISVREDILVKQSTTTESSDGIGVVSIHHVGLLCENLERSLEFYQNLLGLKINEARPNDKLPYRGAWLWVGSEMIHLMELPNPDPLTGRPEHGGRDRHACIAIRDVSKLKAIFDKAGVPYTLSKSGRPAIFARDPDANALEFTQVDV